jgi:hypothetical protein
MYTISDGGRRVAVAVATAYKTGVFMFVFTKDQKLVPISSLTNPAHCQLHPFHVLFYCTALSFLTDHTALTVEWRLWSFGEKILTGENQNIWRITQRGR